MKLGGVIELDNNEELVRSSTSEPERSTTGNAVSCLAAGSAALESYT